MKADNENSSEKIQTRRPRLAPNEKVVLCAICLRGKVVEIYDGNKGISKLSRNIELGLTEPHRCEPEGNAFNSSPLQDVDENQQNSSDSDGEIEENSSESEHDSGESRRRGFRQRFKNDATLFARSIRTDIENSFFPAVAHGEEEIEDCPELFRTAMDSARDQATEAVRLTNSSSEKNPLFTWISSKTKPHNKLQSPPSLQELCSCVLAKNADAIVSLDLVPDVFRHRISQLLCDSRKMNCHFVDLLLRGTPTEVCIRDCSWLNEDEFVKSFEGCDTSKLTILQLDKCGGFIVDYVLTSSLARSSNSLPALQSLSLVGACRLSDIGLTALVSSAPALQSINLSQCSLLTTSSIDTLAKSLGSTLRELYLDHCENLAPMLMISALKKLEHLEVLSLAGIENVCDNFIHEFISARGHNMKELILTDCVRLTNKSIKAISESCSSLRAIDLVNLSNLSDYALGWLATGCQALTKLKLSRNLFSDEAVAAFVEISGGNLRELSLNKVRKVGLSTAISLASFSKNLVSLDLSWCRNLTDDALAFIVDNCQSLRVLKLFGCGQVTEVFLEGHTNAQVEIIGVQLTPLWKYF